MDAESSRGKNKRVSIIEFWRFVAIIVIMSHHAFKLGLNISFAFSSMGWMYADFFFILMGYYTYKHFEDNKCDYKGAVQYIVRKFKGFFPYSAAAVITIYIIDAFRLRGEGFLTVIGSFAGIPVEMLYLALEGKVFVLWFLMALLVAFPIFVLLLQVKENYIICMCSFSIAISYYLFDLNNNINTIHAVMRALGGLSLGAFIGTVILLIKERGETKWNRSVLTIVEIICMVLPLLIMIRDMEVPPMLIIILFFFGLLIMLSGYSYTIYIDNSLFRYLGAISLPMFIWHPVVANLISYIPYLYEENVCHSTGMFPDGLKLVLYFLLTIVVSILSYHSVHRFMNER